MGGINPDMDIREKLSSIRELHMFARGILLDIDFHKPDSYTSISIPIGSIQSVDPMTGTVVVDPKFYGRKGEPARDYYFYNSNDIEAVMHSGRHLRKMVHDATSSSERHLVRFKFGEDPGEPRNDIAKILADVYRGRPSSTEPDSD
jgi:hypothetical protein